MHGCCLFFFDIFAVRIFRATFLIPRARKAPPGSFYTLPLLQIPRP
nr:MAG TPA: hypothetical protein [Caudoviricetes sp.]